MRPVRWWLDPPRVLAAQMRLIDENFAIGMFGCFVASVLVGATLFLSTQSLGGLFWSAAMGLACLAAVRGRYLLPDRLGERGCRTYALCMILTLALVGALWGLLTPLWLDFAEPLITLTILGVTAGMNAAALALFCLCRPVASAFAICSVMPPWISFLAASDPASRSLSFGIPLFLAMMLIFIYRNAFSLRRSIELTLEKDALLAQLREQMDEARAARAVAEQADKAKSVILASASHDLRQPLHALGLFLVALRRSRLQDEQRELVEQAITSARAAEEMLDTLLDFSRLDAGVIKPRRQVFEVQALFYKLERELAPEAEAKGLVYRCREAAWQAEADPKLVELILRNLIINAIRHTPAGGLLVALRRRGADARLEVWDTGTGIAPEHQRRVFEAFHQVGNPQRDRRKGLGLGLAIVDGLAQAMGVRVELASRPGRGSVFTLVLPLARDAVAEPPRLPLPVAAAGGPGFSRVLVVDDDSANCLAMVALFRAWGWACQACETLDEALARLDAGFAPDVLVVDYRLRDELTGLQVIQAINARRPAPLPALVVTGDTAPQRIREMAASGVPVLHKPVGEAALREALQALVPPAAAPVEAATPARLA